MVELAKILHRINLLFTRFKLRVLDRQIARLKKGKTVSLADQERCQTIFMKYYEHWKAKYGTIPSSVGHAEYYLIACKMAVINPERHGGWPYRYSNTSEAYAGLMEFLKAKEDAFVLSCAIIAAVRVGDDEFAHYALRRLEVVDPLWSNYTYNILDRAGSLKPQYRTFLQELSGE
jgi:hypothetical protein